MGAPGNSPERVSLAHLVAADPAPDELVGLCRLFGIEHVGQQGWDHSVATKWESVQHSFHARA
jgi:hypothetical protein